MSLQVVHVYTHRAEPLLFLSAIATEQHHEAAEHMDNVGDDSVGEQ